MYAIVTPEGAAEEDGKAQRGVGDAVMLAQRPLEEAEDMLAGEAAAPAGGQTMPTTASTTAMTASSLLLAGTWNPLVLCPAQAKKTNSSTMCTTPPATTFRPMPVTASAGSTPRLLHEADVQRHATDVGRASPG